MTQTSERVKYNVPHKAHGSNSRNHNLDSINIEEIRKLFFNMIGDCDKLIENIDKALQEEEKEI